MRFDLSDEEWAVIEPLLPTGGRGPKRSHDRRVLNGIFYILLTSAVARSAGAIRSTHHRLQPLRPLGAARGMEVDLRCACRGL